MISNAYSERFLTATWTFSGTMVNTKGEASHHTNTAPKSSAFFTLWISPGMLSALLALIFLALHLPIGIIIPFSIVPLLISSAVLLPGKRIVFSRRCLQQQRAGEENDTAQEPDCIHCPARCRHTLYGFSFYNLGYPILTAATVTGRQSSTSFLLGVLTYAIYLGVSAISGYALGSAKVRSLRSLWLLG